jgi:hypothetical protein
MLRSCKYSHASGKTSELFCYTLQSLSKPTILEFSYVAVQSASYGHEVSY